MPVYLTRNRVKSLVGLTPAITFHDALIDELLDPAEDEVLGYLNVPGLTLTTYSQTFDIGPGQDFIALSGFSVQQVVALTDSGSAVDQDDYYVDEDGDYVRLSTDGAVFTPGRRQVEITYTAGTSPVEARFEQAAAIIAAAWFNSARHAGFETVRTGSASWKLDPDGIPAPARALLNNDRRLMPRSTRAAR